MDHKELGGDFNGFRFKFLEPSEYDTVLKFLETYLYTCSVPVGYDPKYPEDWNMVFRKMMENGNNLSYIAVHIETGEIAACRMVDVVDKDKPKEHFKFLHKSTEDAFVFFEDAFKEEVLYQKYGVTKYADMFGLCVSTKFRKMGLASEMYSRGLDFLKRRGFEVVKCGFISPFSRLAGHKHGYEEHARFYFHECKDKQGNILNPASDPTDFVCFGVFDLRKRN